MPLRDPTTNRLLNLQFIGEAGSKRFLTGGRVKGCCFLIGEPGDVLCIAEGFATGASVHEATGYAVAVAFDCGNLQSVAEAMRARFPNARIVIAADDDYQTAGNPGLTKAREAAAAIGGSVAVPDFGADRPDDAVDFNDLAAHRGADAVRDCLRKAIEGQPYHTPAAAKAKDARGAGKPSQRDKLISIADRAQFWRCEEGIAHTTIPVAGHHRAPSDSLASVPRLADNPGRARIPGRDSRQDTTWHIRQERDRRCAVVLRGDGGGEPNGSAGPTARQPAWRKPLSRSWRPGMASGRD